MDRGAQYDAVPKQMLAIPGKKLERDGKGDVGERPEGVRKSGRVRGPETRGKAVVGS